MYVEMTLRKGKTGGVLGFKKIDLILDSPERSKSGLLFFAVADECLMQIHENDLWFYVDDYKSEIHSDSYIEYR
jgi:hypothetical protein